MSISQYVPAFTADNIKAASLCAPSQFIRRMPGVIAKNLPRTGQADSFIGNMSRGAQAFNNTKTALNTKLAAATTWGAANLSTVPGRFELPVPNVLGRFRNIVFPANTPLVGWMALAEGAVALGEYAVDKAKTKPAAVKAAAAAVLGAVLFCSEPYRLVVSCLWATISMAALGLGALTGMVKSFPVVGQTAIVADNAPATQTLPENSGAAELPSTDELEAEAKKKADDAKQALKNGKEKVKAEAEPLTESGLDLANKAQQALGEGLAKAGKETEKLGNSIKQ